MSFRSLLLSGALTLAVTSVAPTPIAAQTTPAGQLDLQGNWVNKSATPLERPAQLEGRQFLTDAEVAELKKRADRIFSNRNNDFAQNVLRDDVFLSALKNVDQYKSPGATGDVSEMIEYEFDNRTSLIIDPPDGRIPPYTPAGQRRESALLAAIAGQNPPAGPEDLTSSQRCISWGIPMPRPGPNTSYYQIVQGPGYVVVVMEAIHDARIIPVDGRPHLPQTTRLWDGDSVGRWEGKTLVVDTTNFSSKSNFTGSAENLHLVERFTRVAAHEIRYEITVDDLTTWTKPWTAVLRLKQMQDKIYEMACHEGNHEIMEDMLSANRLGSGAK